MIEILSKLQHADPVINIALAFIVYRGVREMSALNEKIAVIIERVNHHEDTIDKHHNRLTFLERNHG